jgi:signal transduction histidine kinase
MLLSKVSIAKLPPNCGPLCQPRQAAIGTVDSSSKHQVADFFKRLFETSEWPARWHCGTWSDFHGWFYIISDLLIWASYFTIPVLIYIIIKKRSDTPLKGLFLLFVAFIILCGTTHLIDAIIFWWPIYRLSALVRFLTAAVSITAVYALYKRLPMILSLRSIDELEKEIAERKVIEEKLAASEFLLSETGKIGKVGGWEMDAQTEKITWSKTVYQIFEIPYNASINRDEERNCLSESYRQLRDDAVARLLSKGLSFDLELEITTKEHHRKWVRCYGEPLFNQAGSLIRIRGVYMDIDRYKNSEINLSTSLEILTRQNQQLKNFTHILSHNIRNHASNIAMLTSFIDKSSLNKDNQDIFNKITIVSNGLNHTLNDLSEAIKIRESVLVSETISFKAITAEVLEIMQTDIQVHHVAVELDYEVETIKFPQIYLHSILMNLISNGIKYKKDTEDPLICLRTYLDEYGKMVLEYIDNGIGIDLDMHGNKIFGLYKTFHERKDAHGVGLFLIKNQVESQGAHIDVYSKPNLGTTFKITFNE